MRFTHHLTRREPDRAGRTAAAWRLPIATVLLLGLALVAIATGPVGLRRFLLLVPPMGLGGIGMTTLLAVGALFFVLPLRHVPLLFGWAAMALVFLVVRYQSVPHFHEGNNAPFDFAFTILAWLGRIAIMGGLWVIRLAAAALRSRSDAQAAANYAAKFRWLVPLHGYIFGGFLALLVQFWIVQQAQGVRPSWIPHVEVLVAIIASGTAARLVAMLGRWLRPLKALTLGFAGGLLLCLFVETGFSRIVMDEAQRLAGARPYCLQVADRTGEYSPVRARLDLSALTMQGRAEGGLYMQYHGALVVQGPAGNAVFHWSYNRRRFVAQGGAPDPVIYCNPEADFTAHLPWIDAVPPRAAAVQVSLGGRTYRIPAAYQPRISGASQDIRIAAEAPDFAPLAHPAEKGMVVLRLAHLSFAPDGERRFLLRNPERSLDAGAEYGLTKRTLYEAGINMLRYQDQAAAAGNDSLIECQRERCIFLFIRDGIGYEFESDPAAVPRWRELGNRLVALFESWRVR